VLDGVIKFNKAPKNNMDKQPAMQVIHVHVWWSVCVLVVQREHENVEGGRGVCDLQ
jgi:hypothetical protein